jgi:CRP-like cAMP-binding protein
MVAASPSKRNRLLSTLSPSDLALLQPHMEMVTLHVRDDLERPNRRIEKVAFVETGIISVVSVLPNSTSVEIGVIGYEGMSATAIVMGDDRSVHHTYVQVAGTARCMSAAALRGALTKSRTMQAQMLKYAQSFALQTAHTAIANARAKLSVRLARWLLMAHDRMQTDEIALTHEFLSVMLGVRRAGVTEAILALAEQKLVATNRGLIIILDRMGIEKVAGSFYGVPEEQYRRLVR